MRDDLKYKKKDRENVARLSKSIARQIEGTAGKGNVAKYIGLNKKITYNNCLSDLNGSITAYIVF